jgi:hypothetical protein
MWLTRSNTCNQVNTEDEHCRLAWQFGTVTQTVERSLSGTTNGSIGLIAPLNGGFQGRSRTAARGRERPWPPVS